MAVVKVWPMRVGMRQLSVTMRMRMGLAGKVDQISADSSLDETSKQIFYTVKVKTESNRLGGEKYNLTIIPGMVASVYFGHGRWPAPQTSDRGPCAGP